MDSALGKGRSSGPAVLRPNLGKLRANPTGQFLSRGRGPEIPIAMLRVQEQWINDQIVFEAAALFNVPVRSFATRVGCAPTQVMIHEIRCAGIKSCLRPRRGARDFVVVIENVVDKDVAISPNHCSLGAVVYGNVAADGDVSRRRSRRARIKLNTFGEIVLDQVVSD